VLITRRPKEAILGGFWECPGGKIEPGESSEQCVVREFREEVGLAVRVLEALPMIEHIYPHGQVKLQPFLCQLITGEPANLAVAEHRWIPPGCLWEFSFPPANGPLIEKLMQWDFGRAT
jgi:mutator protein MutT